MKSPAEVNLPGNLRYTNEHIWAKQDDGLLICGVTDHAQDQLGDVAYVDLPEIGRRVKAGDEFGSIESVKAVNALFMPVDGEIAEVNDLLEDNPEAVNSSCYGDGWIIKIKPDNPDDVGKMLDSDAYRATL